MCSLFLSACARAGFIAANVPSYLADMVVHANLSYGNAPRQSLDIYAPKDKGGAQQRPVIIFFYGGGYQDGVKGDYRFVADRFVREGYIVVIPDYRVYPDVKFPAFVEDGARTVAFIQKNIAIYGGDPNGLFLAGHSAGAHIGALLTADERYLKAAGARMPAIRAFAGLAGPYNFVPEEEIYKTIFGPPEQYPAMQVTNFIDGEEPPMLLLHGAKDKTVYVSNLEKLKSRIAQKGGRVDTKIYNDIDHVQIAGALSWIYKGKAPVAQDMLSFFAKK
jgi:acetyl esterase/lipase